MRTRDFGRILILLSWMPCRAEAAATAGGAFTDSNRLWIVATTTELNGATALSATGDMILVKPGTYSGASVGGLAPGTILVSEAGADQTILEVTQLVLNMNDVVVDGFTFRSTSTVEPVRVSGASNVHLRSCKLIASSGAFGLRIENAQDTLVETSVFSGYGGVLLRSGTSSGTLTLRNNQLVGNTQPVVGGSNPTLQVIFENNVFRGSTYPAINLSSVSSVLSRNNIFDSNYQGLSLSAIPGLVQLTQDTLVHNGAGYNLTGVAATVFDTILQGNSQGLYAANATVSVHHLLHWQDASWLNGSADYVIDDATIWQADPRFVNAAGGDYHLASGSPARGVGQSGADLGAYGGALGGSWRTVPGTPQPAPALLELELDGIDRIDVGDTIRVSAKGHFDSGYYSLYGASYYNSQAQWASADPTVLQSLGDGRFQGLQPGQATATAHSGSITGSFTVTVLAPTPQGYDFYTVVPCRILDTRQSSALVSGEVQAIPVAGLCGVPAEAKAVSLNVTAVAPTGGGFIVLWPADLPQPPTSVVNFTAGATRANNAVLALSTDGAGRLAAEALVSGAGTVHLVIDVNGYFQ